jgi:phage tail sheath protein FI
MNAVVAALPAWRTGISNASFVKDLDNAAKDAVPTNLGSYVRTLISIEKLNMFGTTFSDASFNGYETSGTSWINLADVNTVPAHAAYAGTGAAQAMAVLVDLDKVMKGINSFVNKAFNSANTYASVSQDNVYNNHPVISKIVAALQKNLTLIPPSGSMVGIYSKVDATRGVWKAPANVSINSVVGPSVVIDDLTQEDLNVDVTAGKSINAIRAFTGKGTIVWGARTLNGNSSEWRYINVRRLFIMVEESSKKASSQFVFEPNDANTWVKIRAMIENYLTVLWRQGALAGAKPEHAFFVKVGLGQTMTADDILRGVLIVEIGMAAVRPAEFIILRFMHKMQES